MKKLEFSLSALAAAYRDNARVHEVIAEASARASGYADPAVWIARASEDQLQARARQLDAVSPSERSRMPLFGVPFAVKDNIDVAGMPTSAACPAFVYHPSESAHVVSRLEAAGGIVMGKTNLDQFATGLVGVRSPHGAPRSVFNREYISGGSSAGSAVSVAAGLVAFALGTDTAGSGRVPAALNNIVGLKPTRGLISSSGVVPACRSLDCVSVFATSVQDAAAVKSVAMHFDPKDPYSRPAREAFPLLTKKFRFAVPAPEALEFFGDHENARLFADAISKLEALGGEKTIVSFSPFREAASLLYHGPWVAERTAAVGDFITANREDCDEVVAGIILGGTTKTAVETFKCINRLEALKREVEIALADVDCFVVPTVPTTYTVAAVMADPVNLNARMGIYSNFTNLLDMAAIAIPAGFGKAGLPFGITLMGPAFSDDKLAVIAALATDAFDVFAAAVPSTPVIDTRLDIAVVGAHMSGLPLNRELTSRGGSLVRAGRTAPLYKFYALAGGPPRRPGLVRVSKGTHIALEIWSLPSHEVGGFLAGVPAPLAIGTVELEDGTNVKGFLCEHAGLDGAEDITRYGGWRKFLADAPK